jgi:PhzF family phenazine biosynthesis protein
MPLPIYHVDAFADRPFAGNPAAVCLLPGPADAKWMQNVALEMNLAETAFLHPEEQGYRLRWFTPSVEVDLCGHATLASAHVLWETGLLAPEHQARFYTRSGLLTATLKAGAIELDFPAEPETSTAAPIELLDGLRTQPVYVGKNRFDFLVELASEDSVRNLTPDLNLLVKLAVRGVIVTSRAATPDYDFVSRFFAPQTGVPEDPVTGSAHCCLGPYWQQRLGKNAMTGLQVSARAGIVRVRMVGNRVKLGGKAVTVVAGELQV